MAVKRGKILVIRGGAIGDFILTLPALAALRKTFAETHLELLAYPRVAELARNADIIDEFRSIEARPLARFFARNSKLDEDWSDFFGSFNLIISYLYDPDEIFRTNVGRASKAQFIQGEHRPSEKDSTHAAALFLRPLEQLAIFDADPVPRLKANSAAIASGRWLAAHPGSGSEKKNWPEAHWRKFLHRVISESDLNLLLVSGEAESDRVLNMAAALPSDRIKVARNLSLSELAGLLSVSDLFVGHDSGITHIAAALGVPTLVLWGPSNEMIWRPLNAEVQVLKHSGGLENLPVEKVFETVADRIKLTA